MIACGVRGKDDFCIKFLVLLWILGTVSIVIQLGYHALINHGESSEEVRQCFLRGGTIGLWQSQVNPDRFIHICYLKEGRIGIYIIERFGNIFNEVTSYIKRVPKNWAESLEKYLIRSGNKKIY